MLFSLHTFPSLQMSKNRRVSSGSHVLHRSNSYRRRRRSEKLELPKHAISLRSSFHFINVAPLRFNCPLKRSCQRPIPNRCDLNLFSATLQSNLDALCPDSSKQALKATNEIDFKISNLLLSINKSVLSSKLPYQSSLVPGRMPCWNKDLWALRHQTRAAYKSHLLFPLPLTCSKYQALKSKYQRLFRKSKKQSWTGFCTNDFNGNLFCTLKKTL